MERPTTESIIEGKLIDKLHELYPSGLVQGDAYAIVGSMGLTLRWDFLDARQEKRYKEGERISIVSIYGDILELAVGYPHPRIHYNHFKGFVRYNSQSKTK